VKRLDFISSSNIYYIILTTVRTGVTPIVERILSVKVEIASRYFGGRMPTWQGTLNLTLGLC